MKTQLPATAAEVAPPPPQQASLLAPLPPEVEAEEREVSTITTSLVPRRSPALDELVRLDSSEIERYIANRQKLLERTRAFAITKSDPIDWTIYKDKDSHVVGVPRASGLQKMRPWLGISTFNHQPKGPNGPDPKIESRDEPVLEWKTVDGKRKQVEGPPSRITTATMWCDASCAFTGELIQGIEFTARSDRFAGSGSLEDLRASCRTGLESKASRLLLGLTKVSGAELAAHGVKVEAAYLGHGGGTATERGATKVAEEGVIGNRDELKAEIMRRVGGDADAARQLTAEVTRSVGKDGKPDGKFKGFDSADRLAQSWQVENAWKRLRSHQTFGDQDRGGGGGDLGQAGRE